jgi:hypothetical protein
MYSYFSNPRYQPNYIHAKCQQYQNQLAKEVMKFNVTPLQNSDNAKELVQKFIEPKIQAVEKFKGTLTTNYSLSFNGWVFMGTFVFFHLLDMKISGKNLNELKLPIRQIFVSYLNAFVYTLLISNTITGQNLKSKRQVNRTCRRFDSVKKILNDYCEDFANKK